MEKIFARFTTASSFTLDFGDSVWRQADEIGILGEWNNGPAPPELKTIARFLWNSWGLVLGFECHYSELDMDVDFAIDQERHGLWDRDVCELFLRSPKEPYAESYREFEVAPTGQWCDLMIDRKLQKKDWEWKSRMRTAAVIDEQAGVWRARIEIPFTAFGCEPVVGAVWHGNLFRISRFDGERRYLALSPTLTEKPDFHIPARFLQIEFAD